MAHMYAGSSPTDGSAARIPTLKKQTNGRTENININEEKSKLLYETFFPHPPQRPPADASTQYPDPACNFTPISNKQVLQAIQNLAPYKAPGPNGVYNIVFIKCSDILVPWMGHLFRVTFTLNHFPNEWLMSKTVVIRKPGCPDYGLPKAY